MALLDADERGLTACERTSVRTKNNCSPLDRSPLQRSLWVASSNRKTSALQADDPGAIPGQSTKFRREAQVTRRECSSSRLTPQHSSLSTQHSHGPVVYGLGRPTLTRAERVQLPPGLPFWRCGAASSAAPS